MDAAHGWPWKRLGRQGELVRGCLRCSWGWSRSLGRERRSGARLWCSRVRGHALAEPGGSGHVPQEVRERERRGGLHGGVLRTSRHIDWRKGEARGGRGTRRQWSPALPRAPERVFGQHPRLFRAHSRVHLCLVAAWGSKQCGKGIGCLGEPVEEGRGGERVKMLLSREEKWIPAPFIIASRAGKHTRGRGELVGVVVKSRTHGD